MYPFFLYLSHSSSLSLILSYMSFGSKHMCNENRRVAKRHNMKKIYRVQSKYFFVFWSIRIFRSLSLFVLFHSTYFSFLSFYSPPSPPPKIIISPRESFHITLDCMLLVLSSFPPSSFLFLSSTMLYNTTTICSHIYVYVHSFSVLYPTE